MSVTNQAASDAETPGILESMKTPMDGHFEPFIIAEGESCRAFQNERREHDFKVTDGRVWCVMCFGFMHPSQVEKLQPRTDHAAAIAEIQAELKRAREEGETVALRNHELEIKLRAADAMAKAIDDTVERGALGSRSAIADARLDYSQPFQYETKQEPLAAENATLKEKLANDSKTYSAALQAEWDTVERLKEQAEKLRKDAERLDWLEAEKHCALCLSANEGTLKDQTFWEIGDEYEAPTLRDAIDAAREGR